MSRFLDSSELREAAELLSEIYRPESAGSTQTSVPSKEAQTPIRRSDIPFERDKSKTASNLASQVGRADDRTRTEAESKAISAPTEKQKLSVPAGQNVEAQAAFTRHDQQENSRVSSQPSAVENQTGLDTPISEPEPEPNQNTPFAAILANQQKKKLESISPFRAFQDGNRDVKNPKSTNSPATDNASGGVATAAWLEKMRNDINDLDRGTPVQGSNLSEVGSENKTTTEDKKGLASVSDHEKQNDLVPASPFELNKERNSVRNETLPKRPVWPWEKKEEKPKPIIAIPETTTSNTTESGDEKKNTGWPWTQK